MNIAAIYDKYDLWGKVRVYRGISSWFCVINTPECSITRSGNTLHDAIWSTLKDYIKCEPCEGTGVVPSAPYTATGEIPGCDVVKCKKCNGTGERA